MIVSIIFLILLFIGFYLGTKKGILNSLVELVSSIVIFILANILKRPISLILIERLPFFSFGGLFKEVTTLNILLYEGIAFIGCVIVLSILVKIILKITGMISKMINSTLILGLPNKLGGGVINLIRYYIIGFLLMFILSLIPSTSKYIVDNKINNVILNKTPILSTFTKNINESFKAIYKLVSDIDEETDELKLDEQALKILLDYNIITEDTAKVLYDEGKINVEDLNDVIGKEDKNE